MQRRKRTAILLLAGLLCAADASAQDSGLAFLQIGVDAGALARGDAGVASSRDAFATFWNPAGLAGTERNMVAVSHHIWIADFRTYAASARFGLGDRTGAGIFVTANGAGNLQAREEPGAPIGIFEAQFVSAGVSLGRSLGPLRAGITAKYISERIYTSSANGYAFDFGLQATLLDGGLNAGFALQNVGRMDRLNAEATRLPRVLRAGVEVYPFRILAELDDTRLLSTAVVLEATHNTVTSATQYHVGVSGEVLETLTVRAGYLSNDVLRNFSFGVGVSIVDITFDYALLPFAQGFGGPAHIFTLSYAY